MSQPLIEGQNLSIGYRDRVVIADIQLRVEAGQVLALAGVNGSGKSTLLKTLAGLLPPRGGELKIFGGRPGAEPVRVAYLSQTPTSTLLLPIRVTDVVGLSRYSRRGLFGKFTREDARVVAAAMDYFAITDLANEPLSTLSGGQRQRVFLAQVWAREADLVLLDEPTANLDLVGQEIYQRVIREWVGRGASVVVATHNIREATEADQAMLLAERVVAYGPGASVLTPESLLATFGLIAKLEAGRVVVVEKDHGHDHDH